MQVETTVTELIGQEAVNLGDACTSLAHVGVQFLNFLHHSWRAKPAPPAGVS